MPLSNDELTEYLSALEFLLEGTPQGNNAALTELLYKLKDFVETGDFETAEVTVRLLGTAVGGQKGWQTPYRESGILAYIAEGLSAATAYEDDLAKQYLRVIGNSVADNDMNRELVVKDIHQIISCLSSKQLRTTTLAVLFNICNDFDPAKAAAATLRLDSKISGYLALGDIPEAALDYATDLLTWTTGNLTAAQLKDELSLEVFTNLLRVSLDYDEDHYLEYVAILVHYLQDPEFQQQVATPYLLDNLIGLMLDFEAQLTPEQIRAVFQELATSKDATRTASEETKVLLLAQLIGSTSAVSSTDTFAQGFSIRTPVIERVEAKLRSPWDAATPSTVCSCVMLGNLAMSDEICVDMVQIMELHVGLIDILLRGQSSQSALLYAAAGFMRHLAFPEANRTVLTDAGLMKACCRLLDLTDPSVRGEAAAILCKLVTNNFHNIEKVVYEKVGEATHATSAPVEAGSTILAHIVEQAVAPATPLPSNTMKNPMIELGRTIVAMLRYLGRPNAEKDVDAVRREMFKVTNIARPVARIVRQRFYADARSEGLLGLGLMAQTPEGAAQVIEEIKEDAGLLDAIKEFADGKDGGIEQQGSTAGRDYQNAIVLLQALQNNAGNEMDTTLKDQVIALQEELGKLMM